MEDVLLMCPRCHKRGLLFALSVFEERLVCQECLQADSFVCDQMRMMGIDPSHYVGCGYIPDIKGLTHKTGSDTVIP